jgi:hypothetical protein
LFAPELRLSALETVQERLPKLLEGRNLTRLQLHTFGRRVNNV